MTAADQTADVIAISDLVHDFDALLSKVRDVERWIAQGDDFTDTEETRDHLAAIRACLFEAKAELYDALEAR